MPERLTGRVALVTGGSRGGGAGIARRLSRDGACVAVHYQRDARAASAVVEQITDGGGTAAAFQASMDDVDTIDQMCDAVLERFGAVDLLVSNAGSASCGNTVADSSLSEFNQLLRIHTFGPLHLIRRLLPGLRQAVRGDIVAISSTTVTDAPANAAPYTMAKAAIEVAIRTLAREERGNAIRANIVAPGLVDTEMGARLVQAVHTGQRLSDLHAGFPFGRVCQPDDVAAAVAFLTSDDGGYITGQRIVVDAAARTLRFSDGGGNRVVSGALRPHFTRPSMTTASSLHSSRWHRSTDLGVRLHTSVRRHAWPQ
jgi:NAD(P)-dependent dehydrogenase (short-subunit alcohol dehydrogenase family)